MLKVIKLSWALPALAAAAFTGCAANSDIITSINAIPAENMTLYTASRPKYTGFANSAMPQTMLQVGRLNADNGFLETRIFIRVKYLTKDYWWGLDQPLNNQFGYDQGLPIGYPKRLVEICRTDNGTVMQYKVDNCATPKITITHTKTAGVPTPLRDTTSGQLTLGTDKCLKVSADQGTSKLDPANPTRYGWVNVINNYPATTAWKPLFPNGNKPGFVEWRLETIYSYTTPNVTCNVVF